MYSILYITVVFNCIIVQITVRVKGFSGESGLKYILLDNLSHNPDTIPERRVMEETVDQVLQKILEKLNGFVDTVEPEKLNPQALKHVTATLKDIRDLQTTEQAEPTVRVEFSDPEWKQ